MYLQDIWSFSEIPGHNIWIYHVGLVGSTAIERCSGYLDFGGEHFY